jgi:hypothetical protein
MFLENVASFGAGVYNIDDSHAVVEAGLFQGNRAREGAGLYVLGGVVAARGCTFEGNLAQGGDFPVGGAVSFYFTDSTLEDSLLRANAAELGGGAMYVEGEEPRVERCRFLKNRAFGSDQGWGGGILVSYFCQPRIASSTFVGNRARLGGAGFALVLSAPAWTGCTFTGNAADAGGGAIHALFDTQASVDNSILWGDAPAELAGAAIDVRASCVAGGHAGAGNFAADPLFVLAPDAGPDGLWGSLDDVDGDLRLAAGSPCVDAGDSALVPAGVDADVDGLARLADDPLCPDTGSGGPPVVDPGAHERQP